MKYAQIKLKDELYETLHHMAEEENGSISNMVKGEAMRGLDTEALHRNNYILSQLFKTFQQFHLGSDSLIDELIQRISLNNCMSCWHVFIDDFWRSNTATTYRE